MRLGSVLSIASLVLTAIDWFFYPSQLLYYAKPILGALSHFPLGYYYARAICKLLVPGAAVALGIRAISLGRRASGAGYFVIAIVSVIISGAVTLLILGQPYLFRWVYGNLPPMAIDMAMRAIPEIL